MRAVPKVSIPVLIQGFRAIFKWVPDNCMGSKDNEEGNCPPPPPPNHTHLYVVVKNVKGSTEQVE